MSNFKPNYFQRRSKPQGPKANERIRALDVQVIGSDGKNLGAMPIKKAIAVIGCIPKVIGAKRAIAIAAVRPGIAPIKIPIVTPAISAISGPNVSAFCIPIIRFSIDR